MAIQGPTSNENTLSPLREQLLPYLHYESTFVTNRKTKKKEEIRKYYILDENGIKYYCNGTLGGGGTSFVTLATGPGNTKVAFKTFVMDLVAGSPLQREKELLEREGSLLSTATLKSPSDDPMFEPTVLIVPYFEGAMLSKSLYEHAKDIPNKQSLPIAKKNIIAFELLRECYALQLLDVVHRDLKPDNILIDLKNKQAKLIDFGEATSTHSQYTNTFSIFNPSHLAPECLSGEVEYQGFKENTLLTDEYALAVNLAELYSQQNYNHLYDIENPNRNSPQKIMLDVLGEPITPIEGMPIALLELIRHLCERDPNHRAVNIALANGADALFELKPLIEIQNDIHKFEKKILDQIKNNLTEDQFNHLNEIRDITQFRQFLASINHPKLQDAIDTIDAFCLTKAREIQHSTIRQIPLLRANLLAFQAISDVEASFIDPNKEKRPWNPLSRAPAVRITGAFEIKLCKETMDALKNLQYSPDANIDDIKENISTLIRALEKKGVKPENLKPLRSCLDAIKKIQSQQDNSLYRQRSIGI